MIKEVFFCAIRKNEHHEWLDIKTIGSLPEITKAGIEQTNKEIPGWSKNNPVERIVRVEVSEILNWPERGTEI